MSQVFHQNIRLIATKVSKENFLFSGHGQSAQPYLKQPCSHAASRYADCHSAECQYADYCYAECHYAEYRYAECGYSEYCYAECHYAECPCAASAAVPPLS